jgi:hypothetical protein
MVAAETPKPRWSSWVAVSPSLTPDQQQRIHALRAAREIVDFRPATTAFGSAGTDFKDSLLLVLAMWIVDGKVTSAAEFEADLERWITGRVGEKPDG